MSSWIRINCSYWYIDAIVWLSTTMESEWNFLSTSTHTLTHRFYHLPVWQIYCIIDIIILFVQNVMPQQLNEETELRVYVMYVSINNNAHVKCGFYHCTEKLYWWIANNRHVTAPSQYWTFYIRTQFQRKSKLNNVH